MSKLTHKSIHKCRKIVWSKSNKINLRPVHYKIKSKCKNQYGNEQESSSYSIIKSLILVKVTLVDSKSSNSA